jgi:hypothetical protein
MTVHRDDETLALIGQRRHYWNLIARQSANIGRFLEPETTADLIDVFSQIDMIIGKGTAPNPL